MLLEYYKSRDTFRNYLKITGLVYWRLFVFLGAGYNPTFNFSQTIKMWDTKYEFEMTINYHYGKMGKIITILTLKF